MGRQGCYGERDFTNGGDDRPRPEGVGRAEGDALKALIPTGRFAEPEEIAATALFLASEASNMINGADILVDGGYTIQ